MLFSIQLVCVALSLIFAATMSVDHFRARAFLKYRDGIVAMRCSASLSSPL
ncbi:hypothetical protein [Neorhizobium sp. NCHU2750]|uniref:hypothetical protein n=1 Tax=Neorhizobium sp. NCHU2750 TaxID=1825976 RepID=UPI000EB6DE53|nr:hypothetical protein NCHU2750_54700 [Neorhizobium sp. NCHU2750]